MSSPLPTDIILDILDHIPSQADLLCFRAATKTFRAVVSPRVFRVLHVTSTPQSATSFSNLISTPSIAALVEEVAFGEKGGRERERTPATGDDAMLTSFTSAYASLSCAPNLKSLSFIFDAQFVEHDLPMFWKDEDSHPVSFYLHLQWTLFDALTRNTFPHPSLRSLTIKNLLPFPHTAYTKPGWAGFMASLHHLSVSVIHEEKSSYFRVHYIKFWDAFSTCFLRHATALRSFVLKVDLFIGGGVPTIDFGALASAHLTSLKLKHVMFAETVWRGLGSIEDCILRHKSTLRTLTLLGCVMMRGVTPVLWADVWDRFSGELEALMVLDVVFERPKRTRPRTDKQTKYVRLDPNSRYMPAREDPPGNERDLPALNACLETVKARRMAIEVS
ncbi:hypothetical protein OF83DRAFT_150734 [Amylostereum chailletii]|nr:hypothetical protein OF83DRAFT_150734 [Amylostereum chailletii]